MTNYVLPTILGGFGILLIAYKIFSTSMKDLISDYVRKVIKKNTVSNFQTILWGCILGFLAIDPLVVICIVGSLFTCKSITAKKAMTICAWSNFGACFLFFIAFVNMDLLILYLLGIVGFACFIEKPFHLRHFMGSLFALLLMLYALMLIKSQSGQIIELQWVKESLHEIHNDYLVPFVLASILTAIMQSDLIVLVLTANLSSGHILSDNQMFFMVYGTQLGLGIISTIIAFNVKGIIKQLVCVQAMINLVIGSIFSILLLVEIYSGIPLIKALALSVTDSMWLQMLFIIFLTNAIICLVFTVCIDMIYPRIDKLFPLLNNTDPAHPKFIGIAAVNDPSGALDLFEEELLDLFKRIPQSIAYKIANLTSPRFDPTLQLKHNQFKAVIQEMEELLRDLNNQLISSSNANRMLILTQRMHLVSSLENDTYQLVQINLPSNAPSNYHHKVLEIYSAQQKLFNSIISIIDVEEVDINALMIAIADFQPLLEKFRMIDGRTEKHASILGKALILKMATLVEKNVWILETLCNQFLPKQLYQL